MTSVILYSQSLASKWGFEDGDILDDIIYDAGIEDDDRPEHEHLFFEHEVLVELVEKYLLPLCPDIKTSRISTIHNPIRLAPGFIGEVPDVGVEIPAQTVVEMARRVRADRDKRAAEHSALRRNRRND